MLLGLFLAAAWAVRGLGGLPLTCDAVPPLLGLFLDALVRLFVFFPEVFLTFSSWVFFGLLVPPASWVVVWGARGRSFTRMSWGAWGAWAGNIILSLGPGAFLSGGGIVRCVFCDGGASTPPLTHIHLDSPSRTSLCGLSSRLNCLRLWPHVPQSLGSASAGVVYGPSGCSFLTHL